MSGPVYGERQVLDAILTISEETGHPPDTPELADVLGITTRKVHSFLREAKRRGDVRYDDDERYVLRGPADETSEQP